MNARSVEAFFIVVMAVAVLVGGRSLLVQIAQYHATTIAILATIAIALVAAFRRNFTAGGPLVRLQATRDAAFLAAIAAAIAFVASPARWSLGAAVVGVEFGLIVEFFIRVVPQAPADRPPEPR